MALGIPLFVVAQRKGRTKTIRRFLIAAGVIGLFTALVSAGSESLESRCEAVGNFNCLDFGSTGLQFIFILATPSPLGSRRSSSIKGEDGRNTHPLRT
ncbi:MAG: hypothetical protein V3U46_00240 [Acidimicrobiia bacterium]